MIKFNALAILFCCIVVPTLSGQESPAFFIESIVVRNVSHASSELIISETRLNAGATYSERDLAAANDRLNRLPYVISADFSLEKGSERDRYVLVIRVNETRSFFSSVDARFYLRRSDNTSVAFGDNLGAADHSFAVGWRFFPGRRSGVHLALQAQDDDRPYTIAFTSLVAGYTQYDIFGTGAFATLNLRRPIDRNGSAISPQVVIGAPLTAAQTLTVSYDSVDLTSNSSYYDAQAPFNRVPYVRRNAQQLVKASWSYNTTNNPFVPTKGVIVTATPLAVWLDRQFLDYERDALPSFVPKVVISHEKTYGLEASARRFFELSERNSWGAGISGGFARTNLDYANAHYVLDRGFGVASALFSHSLWTREKTAQEGDSRLEAQLSLRAQNYHRRQTDVLESFYADGAGQASVSWVRRNAWGSWRFGLGYAW